MVMLSQSGKTLMDFQAVDRMVTSTSSRGNAILAIQHGQGGQDASVMGVYQSNDACLRVLGSLFNAISEDRKSFEFPQPEQLPTNKGHHGSGGGRRHGGS